VVGSNAIVVAAYVVAVVVDIVGEVSLNAIVAHINAVGIVIFSCYLP
jgi:hypothetical protein